MDEGKVRIVNLSTRDGPAWHKRFLRMLPTIRQVAHGSFRHPERLGDLVGWPHGCALRLRALRRRRRIVGQIRRPFTTQCLGLATNVEAWLTPTSRSQTQHLAVAGGDQQASGGGGQAVPGGRGEVYA